MNEAPQPNGKLNPEDKDAVSRFRDEWIMQIPAHSGYILAITVGIVVLAPTWFDVYAMRIPGTLLFGLRILRFVELVLLSVALVVLVVGFVSGVMRLLYYIKLVNSSAIMLGMNGAKEQENYTRAMSYVHKNVEQKGVTQVIFADLERQIDSKQRGRVRRTFTRQIWRLARRSRPVKDVGTLDRIIAILEGRNPDEETR